MKNSTTSFDTVAEGINRKGRFTGALTITHNATSLILPGVANITTAANDRYEARSLGSGNWIVTKYQKADGTAVVAAAASGIPSGTILDFGGTAVPSGYLGCGGSNVSRATYAALFTAIGTTWGVGDGSTTFGLPNFSRRAAVGSGGTGTGTLGNAVGNTGGAETHTLSTRLKCRGIRTASP